MSLTDDEIEALAPLPEHKRAHHILRGTTGPLLRAGVEPFDEATARLGYLVLLAYRAGRSTGILKGRPAYEAKDALRARVLSAIGCSHELRDFGRQLFDRIGSSLSAQKPEVLLWWRSVWSAHSEAWYRLSSDGGVEEILAAFAILTDTLHLTRTNTKETTP